MSILTAQIFTHSRLEVIYFRLLFIFFLGRFRWSHKLLLNYVQVLHCYQILKSDEVIKW